MQSDAEFLSAFREGQVPSLTHHDHVRLAWIVLQREPLLSAIEILREWFASFAESKGKPELFHETITWAFTILINERIERGMGGKSWHEFAEANADLCQGRVALDAFYRRATLDSDLARRAFVLPDVLGERPGAERSAVGTRRSPISF